MAEMALHRTSDTDSCGVGWPMREVKSYGGSCAEHSGIIGVYVKVGH